MTILLFANNAKSTLAANLSSSATTVTLASGTGSLFPSPTTGQGFKLTFNDDATGLLNEIVLCTSRTGDVLTIVRAQEGTTAQSWLANDLAGMFYTAGSEENNIQLDQYQNGTYITATAAGTANALVATIPSNLTTVPTNFTFTLQAAAANTGAATLNLTMGSTATGVRPIVKSNNQPLIAGDIASAGYPMWLAYSPVYNAYVLMNPGTGESTALSPQQLQQQFYTYGIATGGSDTIAVPIQSSLTSLTDGYQFEFKAAFANGTTTPNITLTLGTTAQPTKTIVKGNNQPLAVGDIPGAGAVCQIVYSSAFDKYILLNPYTSVATNTIIQTKFVSSTIGQVSYSPTGLNVLSLTVTPQYASSKILIQMVCSVLTNGEGTQAAFMQMQRGGSFFGKVIMGVTFQGQVDQGTDTPVSSAQTLYSQYLDSPNTTSPTTYNMLIATIPDEAYDYGEYYPVFIGDAIPTQNVAVNLNYSTPTYSILIQEIKF